MNEMMTRHPIYFPQEHSVARPGHTDGVLGRGKAVADGIMSSVDVNILLIPKVAPTRRKRLQTVSASQHVCTVSADPRPFSSERVPGHYQNDKS